MKKKDYCEFEMDNLAMLRAGQMSDELQAHIASCPVCADSASVFNWMQDFNRMGQDPSDQVHSHPLPAAESIWSRAKAPELNHQNLVKRAMRPMVIGQIVTYIIGFIGVIYLLFGKLPFIKRLFGEISQKSELITSVTSLFDSLSKTLPFLIVPLAMVSVLLLSYFIYSLIHPESA